jgi:hypothetical protein
MTLEDALLEILVMNNAETFTSSQVYSILSDLGVFKSNPKLKIVLKIALEYGLWNMIVAKADSYKVDILKTKLENDGFADSVITEIIATLQPVQHKEHTPTIPAKQVTSTCPIPSNIAVRSQFAFSFPIKRGIDCGIVTPPSSSNEDAIELSYKLYIAPSWNKKTRIIINEIKFETYYRISYKITCNPNLPIIHTKVKIALLVETIDGYLYAKHYVNSVDVREKYAVTTGVCTIFLKTPISNIDKVIFLPEAGDFDISYIGPSNLIFPKGEPVASAYNKFSKLDCNIVMEPIRNSTLNLIFSDFRIWGYKNVIYISFTAIGMNNQWQKGFFNGDNYLFAFFNEKNDLIITNKVFFGKQGIIGPRGGLHDTYMAPGNIQFVYMEYLKLPTDSSLIKKIIITSGR